MKKILMFFGVAGVTLLLSGCGTNEMLACTSEVTSNGMTTRTRYDIEYKDNDVKHLRMTYHYTQDENVDGVGTGTDGSASDGNDTGNDDIAGDIDSNESNDSDDVVDGAVGGAIDSATNTVTDTILDLSGIRDRYNNQLNSYSGIEGFSSDVQTDSDNEYKIVYNIDYSTISDSDLSLFNASRDLDALRSNYESQGLTCK